MAKYNAILISREGKIIKPLNAPLANAAFLVPEIRYMEDMSINDVREVDVFETAYLVDHRFFDPALVSNDMGVYVVADSKQEATTTYRCFMQSRHNKQEFAEVKKAVTFQSLTAAAERNRQR